MAEVFKNYIGGQWVAARSEKTFPNVNPANTGEVVGHFQVSGAEDVEAACEAAAQLLTAWGDSNDELQQVVTFVLQSMFRDSAFRASDVQVYRIHWDNADDTNAEGIG